MGLGGSLKEVSVNFEFLCNLTPSRGLCDATEGRGVIPSGESLETEVQFS